MNNTDIPEIWDKLLKQVDSQTEKPGYSRWVRTAMPQSLSNDTLEIMVEKQFIKDWLEDKYLGYMEENLSTICKCPMKIKIFCPSEQIESNPIEQAAPTVKLAQTPSKAPPAEPFESNLVSKYDFENFVIGNSNRFAHAAALAVAEAPAKVYNPLFLYSSSGLGKTHLMHAIGNRIKQNNPDMKILYISSETFTNEMINSIQNNAMEAFRNKYRNIDVLLIDDIQFLRKKESNSIYL